MKSKVSEIMEARETTVRQLVAATGLSIATIMKSRGETIESCTLRTLATIAAALGCKVKDLFEE